MKEFPKDAIGITSTIPIEIPLAAGRKILDLNNFFISQNDPIKLIRIAEADGFPRNCCAWIKGIYGTVKTYGIKKIIFVTGGDCSNTHALMETLLPDLDEIYTFSYPFPANSDRMKAELEQFCSNFNISFNQAEKMGERLASIRNCLNELDTLTWRDSKVLGSENFKWLISSSDFEGSYEYYYVKLRQFLSEASRRSPQNFKLRIGFLGVPPIITDLLEFLEKLGIGIVFNEIPRQFAMISSINSDLVRRYCEYTYPYGILPRIEDILTETSKRKLDGLIHYTQSFCHRQIHDIMIRRKVNIPILTIEGETPAHLDQRTKLRLEGFVELLLERKQKGL